MVQTLTGFARPGITDIRDRVATDVNARLPGADARLARGVLPALAHAQAAAENNLHGHLDFISRQSHPLFAVGATLEAWGALWEIARKPASAASGQIALTGTDGIEIPVGTPLRRGDGGLYTVTVAATVAGGTAEVTALADATGVAGNAAAGVALSLPAPVAGIDNTATVAAPGLAGGADTEPDGDPGDDDPATFRGRILLQLREPPHGGNARDYIAWAFATPGVAVTDAWVYPQSPTDGEVTVLFMTHGATADGIPTAGDVVLVQAYIDSVRPVTAKVVVAAPVAVPLALTVSGLDPDTATVKAALEASFADMLRTRAVPAGTISLSWVGEAISTADGEIAHVLDSPTADVEHTAGQIATPGTVTYG